MRVPLLAPFFATASAERSQDYFLASLNRQTLPPHPIDTETGIDKNSSPANGKDKTRPIGFRLRSRKPEVDADVDDEIREDVLLEFDSSKRYISFDDAAHHLIALGTTGSGKTECVIFPALRRLCALDAAGLLIDVKGNLRAKGRAIIEAEGREADYMELGTESSATPINILKGMTPDQLREFFEPLILSYFNGQSTNMDWVMRGIAQTIDCAWVLYFLWQKYPEYEPTLRLVLDMLESPNEAAALYDLFVKKIFDSTNIEHVKLKASVDSNHFHVLKKESKSSGSTFDEQQTWNLNTSRSALRAMLEASGIEANFCKAGAPRLDFAKLLIEGKIVFLRFSLDSGRAGRMLGRLILERFYAAVFQLGRERVKRRKYFVCIDEFQEVADLSGRPYSDASFISMAREFGCAFIAATQSISAIVNKGQSLGAALAFISNCNQRIMFYTDDPATQAIASIYDDTVKLSAMNPGEAFAITYNKKSRKHLFATESLNEAFASTHDIVSDIDAVDAPRPDAKEPSRSIFALRETTNAILSGSYRLASRNDESKTEMEEIMNVSRENVPDEIAYAIYREFPDFFDHAAPVSGFRVPAGWVKGAARAFRLFSRVGVSANIARFQITGDGLRAETAAPESGRRASADIGISILNSLLSAHTSGICLICGSPLDPEEPEEDEFEFDEDGDPIDRSPRVSRSRGRKQSLADHYICAACLECDSAPRC